MNPTLVKETTRIETDIINNNNLPIESKAFTKKLFKKCLFQELIFPVDDANNKHSLSNSNNVQTVDIQNVNQQ